MRRINCHHPEYAQTVTISGGDLLGRYPIKVAHHCTLCHHKWVTL